MACLALLLTLLFPSGSLPGEWTVREKPRPRLRALLIGCDEFVTQENTWPAADNNLKKIADVLMSDRRGYALIRSASSTVSSLDALEALADATFQNARPGDLSLLYFSTHGLLSESEYGATAALLLSDGREECAVTGGDLERILDRIPGRKMLILDACNSGAMIGKGLSGRAERVFFAGKDYRVLCSAGGSEASWYWQGKGSGLTGASYFAEVLAAGLSEGGDHAADINRDGNITLEEIYAFLLDNCAVSTPQVYPQQDRDFILFSYDPDKPVRMDRAVTDITFEDTLLTAGDSEAKFSFTMQRQAELYYQIIYHQDGVWQFDSAQQFLDGEQPDGTVLPGRKERTLVLSTPGEDLSGYAIIQLITREDGVTHYQGSRLLCVQPAEGEVRLAVETESAFTPGIGQEMPILVRHDVPCGLSVSILNAQGRVVRRLSYDAPSRPQQLTPEASTFYWNGALSSGAAAPPGLYRAQVQVRLGEKTYEAVSPPFQLMEREP